MIYFILVTSLYGSSAAQAGGERCLTGDHTEATLQACENLKETVETKRRRVAATLSGMGDLARGPNGEILRLTFNEAKEYCEGQRGRLPTSRELIYFTQSRGAEGVKATQFPDAPYNEYRREDALNTEMRAMGALGYQPLFTRRGNNAVVAFYFSLKGYEPVGERREGYIFFSEETLWSSSKFYDWSYVVLRERDGRPANESNLDRNAFRCVRG